jgi:basic amino acid/polyamine antiporter, APA family
MQNRSNQPLTDLADAGAKPSPKPGMGFWKVWSMTVGVMIGSGIFLLPAVLAPFGSLGFLGWVFTSIGAILIALILGRLAGRTERTGGPYAYAHDAFGNLPGFLVGWGYWLAVVFAISAISVAFSGYLGALVPAIGASTTLQAGAAMFMIWLLTAINMRGIAEATSVQLVMALLKLLPLVAIIALGVLVGDVGNIPPFNPLDKPVIPALAATALLTMWAFLGIEAGVIPVGDVRDAKRTIPRAIILGTLTVTVIYIASTAAVMMLVPSSVLVTSQAPFVDAAQALGPLGVPLIAIGALIATAGSMNGNILLGGQMPMAAALDGLAPKFLARRNKGHAPYFSLLISSSFSTVLVVFNYTEGLVSAFTFLISMSTLSTLVPYAVSALADLRYSWKQARLWAIIALIAIVYTLVAMIGSGLKVLIWGVPMLGAGVPVFYGFQYLKGRANPTLKS